MIKRFAKNCLHVNCVAKMKKKSVDVCHVKKAHTHTKHKTNRIEDRKRKDFWMQTR